MYIYNKKTPHYPDNMYQYCDLSTILIILVINLVGSGTIWVMGLKHTCELLSSLWACL